MASLPLPGAPAVFLGVSCRRLPLGGSATFLAPVACPAPEVEPCCWVGGVAWFSTLCHALLPGPAVCAAYPAAGYPYGFSDFSVTGCLTYCCPGGVGWATTLPLYFLCFSCAGWLAGVRWVLHPVSGSSPWGSVCSLGDSIITLLAFPYLRVGALLA